MLLPVQAHQLEQNFQPLLRCETSIVGAIGGVGLAGVIEFADDALH